MHCPGAEEVGHENDYVIILHQLSGLTGVAWVYTKPMGNDDVIVFVTNLLCTLTCLVLLGGGAATAAPVPSVFNPAMRANRTVLACCGCW